MGDKRDGSVDQVVRQWLMLPTLGLVSLFGACEGSTEASGAGSCEPGEPVACATTTGCQGIQFCADAGDRLGPCVCQEDGGLRGSGSTAGAAGTAGSGGTGGVAGAAGAAVSSGGADATTACGNGFLDALEACDGADLGGARCASLTGGVAWDGVAACLPNCTLDATGCIAPTGTCPTTNDKTCDEPAGCPRGTDTQDCCVTDDFYCGVQSRACISDGCCMNIVSCALDHSCFDLISCNQPTTCQSVVDACGGPDSRAALDFDALETCFGLCARTPSHAGPGAPVCTVAEPAPSARDLYVMIDTSTTMSNPVGTASSKWDAVVAGVRTLVNDGRAAGTGLAVHFFAQPDLCNADAYAVPTVPMGRLPAIAQDVSNAVSQEAPNATTRPLAPALEGALQYAEAWAQQDPSRPVAVVLLTDGFPTDCGVSCSGPADCLTGVCTAGMCEPASSVSDIAARAERYATGVPAIRTYVIGLGSGLGNLSAIARVGGTGAAYLLDTGDVATAISDTLLDIATTAQGCEFRFCDAASTPNPQTQDVVVQLSSSSSGVQVIVPRLDGGASACSGAGGSGWYYDDPSAPSRIILCPGTCSNLGASEVEFRIVSRAVPEGGAPDASGPAPDAGASDASQPDGGTPDGG